MKDFIFEPKFTLSEELAYKAVLGVEDRKTTGMFCIVSDGLVEKWFYSDEDTSLDV